MAARRHAVSQLRELHRAAFAALAGHKTGNLPTRAVLLCQRGFGVFLGTHAPFELDAFVIRKQAKIGFLRLRICQRTGNAACRLEAANGIGSAKHKCVTTLAKTDHQNQLAGLADL